VIQLKSFIFGKRSVSFVVECVEVTVDPNLMQASHEPRELIVKILQTKLKLLEGRTLEDGHGPAVSHDGESVNGK
jgi:hypothetical protein